MGFFNDMFLKIKKLLGREQKALPQPEEIKVINVKEREEAKKEKSFKEQLVDDAKVFRPENMPTNEAIIEILKQQGMKEEIAKNEDALKLVLDVAYSKIGGKEISINSQNLEQIQAQLSKIIEKGAIVDKETYPWKEYGTVGEGTKTRTIDVNKENKALITETKIDEYDVYSNEKKYHTYTSNKTSITIEDGMQMTKENEYSTRTYDPSERKYIDTKNEGYTITRNPDLVTAYVRVRNGEANLAQERGGYILVDGGGVEGRLSNGLGFETDIEQIDEARKEGRPPQGFLNKGFSEDLAVIQKEEENVKNMLADLVKKSKVFEKMAAKKGLIESPVVDNKEQDEK